MTSGTVPAEVKDIAASNRQLLQHRLIDILQQGKRNWLDYSIGEELGAGTFGRVFADVDNKVAIKKTSCPHQALQEMSAHLAIPPHLNIVALLDVGVHDGQLCLIFARHTRDLRAHTHGLPILGHELRHIMSSLSEGVCHMHKHGIVHTDLKPKMS